jgi:hypothetical protein
MVSVLATYRQTRWCALHALPACRGIQEERGADRCCMPVINAPRRSVYMPCMLAHGWLIRHADHTLLHALHACAMYVCALVDALSVDRVVCRSKRLDCRAEIKAGHLSMSMPASCWPDTPYVHHTHVAYLATPSSSSQLLYGPGVANGHARTSACPATGSNLVECN